MTDSAKQADDTRRYFEADWSVYPTPDGDFFIVQNYESGSLERDVLIANEDGLRELREQIDEVLDDE